MPGCLDRVWKRVLSLLQPPQLDPVLEEKYRSETAKALAERAKEDPSKFNYFHAFFRNIGWITRNEQGDLSKKRVAIGGLGGAGGIYAVTMARLGVGKFHIADFDLFEVHNFNRQYGAAMSTVGKSKVQVIADQVRDINPNAEIVTFEDGITPQNIDQFLAGVDCYMDGLDFFAYSARELTFAACARLGVPATTVAPLGFGAAMINFVPGGMTFEEYFRWADCKNDDERAVKFIMGLAPAGLQAKYCVDPTAVNLAERRGPSTMCAITLCAGMASTQAIKMMLGRGPIISAPHGMHIDMYTNQVKYTWRPWGNANPLQRLMIAIGGAFYLGQLQADKERLQLAKDGKQN